MICSSVVQTTELDLQAKENCADASNVGKKAKKTQPVENNGVQPAEKAGIVQSSAPDLGKALSTRAARRAVGGATAANALASAAEDVSVVN